MARLIKKITEIDKIMAISGKNATELAKLLNVSKSTISKYRSGNIKITLEKLKKLCELLEVDIKEVL